MKKSRPGKRSKRFLRNNKVLQGLVAWDNFGGLGVYLIVKRRAWPEDLPKDWFLYPVPMAIFDLGVCHSQLDYQADLVVKEIEQWRKSAHRQMDKIKSFQSTRELCEWDLPW